MTNDLIRLHNISGSRSFRALWLLCEMGITPELVQYSITDGSLRTADFLKISPAGRVPALDVDGLTIYESGAIIEYLCETRPEHGFGRAPGDVERVPYLEAIHYAETMASIVASLNLQWLFLRDPSMRSDVVAKIDARRLEATIAPLDALLGKQDYILASGFSAADMMLGYNFLAAPYFVRLEPYPNIRAYIERMQARPGFQRAQELDGPSQFYKQDFYEVTG